MQKMIKVIVLLLAVGLFVFPYACTTDTLEPSDIVTVDCDTLAATYSELVKPIIENSCSYDECHSGSGDGPGDFTTYAGLENYFSDDLFKIRVIDQAGSEEAMPPPTGVPVGRPTSLTQQETNILKCWINAGFPE